MYNKPALSVSHALFSSIMTLRFSCRRTIATFSLSYQNSLCLSRRSHSSSNLKPWFVNIHVYSLAVFCTVSCCADASVDQQNGLKLTAGMCIVSSAWSCMTKTKCGQKVHRLWKQRRHDDIRYHMNLKIVKYINEPINCEISYETMKTWLVIIYNFIILFNAGLLFDHRSSSPVFI